MRDKGFLKFLFIWFGQLVSIIGSKITIFGLSLWVLEETGSITDYALVLLSITVPAIIVAPFAGVIVDRFRRKTIMIVSDSVAGISTAAILILLVTGNFEVWHIYITGAVSAFFSAFQSPAYQSTIPLMVSKKNVPRANGLNQLSNALGIIIAPLIAGFVFYTSGLKPIIIIDFATFIFAVFTLAIIKFPELVRDENEEKLGTKVFFKEALLGFKYLSKRSGLLWLLLLFAISNLLIGFFDILVTPYLRATVANELLIGTVIAIVGFSMFLGGIIMGIWGGPKNRIKGLIVASCISGVLLSASGVTSNIVVITTMMALSFIVIPILNALSTTIFQTKVDPKIQGRVFSLIRMVAMSLSPITYIAAGPLADQVFEPLMSSNGALADSIGSIIGTGEGRGIGLMFIIIGLLWVLFNLLFYLNPRIRKLESEIPDIENEDEQTPPDEGEFIEPAVV